MNDVNETKEVTENIALGIVTVPYGEGNIALVPDSILEAILPIANLLPAYNEHYAVVGAFIYEDIIVPVVDLVKLIDKKAESQKKQLVVLNSINEDSSVARYALIADKMSNRITIHEEGLEEIEGITPIKGFYSKVTLTYQGNQRQADILDIDKIETMLFP